MPDTTRTPDDIERDIERERSELGRTVNELQDRFSPDHIFREIGRGLSDHGSDIGEAVTRSVKRNPVALALTGVGLAWLMSGRSWDEDAQRVFPNGNGRRAEARYDAARPVPAGTRPAHPEAMRTHGPGGALDDPAFVPPAGAGTAADTSGHFGARRGDDWLYADDDHFWDDLDEDDHDDEPGFGTRAASNLRGMADQAGDGVSSAADSVGEGAARAREQAA